ncbi:hypothetical protein PVAP13_5NG482200 [Panicum virgatum]|uniref:Uncharacterized protein n=1 Tax=Panicum virgatum TaxID=38727 RepID=A0A8T0S4G6_PANVG|nr:hypothetical protein PVAP13_5NG482200 [Panicum virgatum]
MKQTVVLYPGAGVGHVNPMAELAKVFVSHGYDVTMVIVPPPFKSSALGTSQIEQIAGFAAANPSISFHVLPPIPAPEFAGSPKHPFLLMLQMLRQYNDKLESFLRSIPRQRLHSLVVDMFCVDAIDVAAKLGVPAYTFVPSGASSLAVVAQLPTLLAGRQTGLEELGDTPLEFLGVPPMPASHLIAQLLAHPEDVQCKTMLSIFERSMDSRAVLVNTVESLESRAVQALRDPLCVPGKVLPPIYCVGPLVSGGGARNGEKTERHECLAWLDAQLERSVVFLCFGSMVHSLSSSSRRSPLAWRSPGNGSYGSCAFRATSMIRRGCWTNHVSRTSMPSYRRVSWSTPRIEALLSSHGHRRWMY